MKTAFKISFKGSNYMGWQVQPRGKTVQKTLQNAIEHVLGREVNLTGCGRTDSGVHANEFICHINFKSPIENQKLHLALNMQLPKDICVLKAFDVSDDFHSRYDSTGKEYVYYVWNSFVHNVFYDETSFRYPKHLDINSINELAKELSGTHDFRSFMADRSKIVDTVRTIFYFKAERETDFVKFFVAADGFLYNMVRIIIGTVIDILSGRIKISLSEIIKASDRRVAGQTAPAKGLFLNKVFYNNIIL